jgi:hypothetical protein
MMGLFAISSEEHDFVALPRRPKWSEHNALQPARIFPILLFLRTWSFLGIFW